MQCLDEPEIFAINTNFVEKLKKFFMIYTIKRFFPVYKTEIHCLLHLYCSFAQHAKHKNGVFVPLSFILFSADFRVYFISDSEHDNPEYYFGHVAHY